MSVEEFEALQLNLAETKFPGHYRSICTVIDLGPEHEPYTIVSLAPVASSDSPQSQPEPVPSERG